MLLVNVLLKLWSLNMAFFGKNTCELDMYLLEQLTFWPLTSSLSFEQLGPGRIYQEWWTLCCHCPVFHLVQMFKIAFYTPPHYSGGVLWFHVGRPWVHPSYVHPSIRFSFPDDNLSKHQWIFTKLGMCIDIVEFWFGLLMGKFHQFFTELSAQDTPIFSFLD